MGGGALLLVLTHLIPLSLAGRAIAKGTDVYLFLAGMMLLSEIAREQGVFDWIASVAVHHARGSATRLFALRTLGGVTVTVCLSNDATAIVLTPAVLASVRRAHVNPLPFLFACAMIANAASFVLPISNPANLVVFHNGMPPLSRWLDAFLLPSLLSIVVTYVVLRLDFRRDLTSAVDASADPVTLTTNGKLILVGLALVVAVLLTASAFGKDLGLPTFVAAIAITTILLIRTRSSPTPILKQISWSTIALVAALFILVEAIESIGALTFTQRALFAAQHFSAPIAASVVGFTVSIANNLINNLPLALIAANTLTLTHTQGASPRRDPHRH